MLEGMYPVNPEAYTDESTPLTFNVNGVNVHLHGNSVKNPIHEDENERQHLTYSGHALRNMFKALNRMPPKMAEDFKNYKIHVHGPDSPVFRPQIPFIDVDEHENNPHVSKLDFYPGLNDDNNYHILLASKPTFNLHDYPWQEEYEDAHLHDPMYYNPAKVRADALIRFQLGNALSERLFKHGIVKNDVNLLQQALSHGLAEPDIVNKEPLKNAFRDIVLANPFIKQDVRNLYNRWFPPVQGSSKEKE